jgi:hypothetical protein
MILFHNTEGIQPTFLILINQHLFHVFINILQGVSISMESWGIDSPSTFSSNSNLFFQNGKDEGPYDLKTRKKVFRFPVSSHQFWLKQESVSLAGKCKENTGMKKEIQT